MNRFILAVCCVARGRGAGLGASSEVFSCRSHSSGEPQGGARSDSRRRGCKCGAARWHAPGALGRLPRGLRAARRADRQEGESGRRQRVRIHAARRSRQAGRRPDGENRCWPRAPSPESANPDGETALMVAIKTGEFPIVDMLIKAGANVNVIEKFHNQTPLMYAADAPKNAGADGKAAAFERRRASRLGRSIATGRARSPRSPARSIARSAD